jgi:hypothetical protein
LPIENHPDLSERDLAGCQKQSIEGGRYLKERTGNNVHDTFIGEAKAYQRLLTFARKAADERSH